MTDISIVIPNWNGKKFLENCFKSIASQSFQGIVETLLVDNGSHDESLEYTKKNFPWVKMIEVGFNSGFSGAVNRGIQAAEGEFIALLNNDTELHVDWITEIMKAASEYSDVSFFASKMLDFKDRTIIDSCGDGLNRGGGSYKIGSGEKDSGQHESKFFVFGACAGAAVYRRELFVNIGLFDEDFFAYLEDVDIDFRAQLLGYRCLFVPHAKVFHIGSATSGISSPFLHTMVIKNHFHLIYKNFPLGYAFKNSNRLLKEEIRLIVASLKHRYFKEYILGFGKAITEAPRMVKKRGEIQKKRVVNYDYLDSILSTNSNYKPLGQAIKDTLSGKTKRQIRKG